MGCRLPFEVLYLLPYGNVTCCQDWVDREHWLLDESLAPAAVWTAPQFEALRDRVRRGDFGGCQKCVRVTNGDVPESLDGVPARPRHLILCNDLACNLHCWSCREKPIGRTEWYEVREARMLAMLAAYLPTARLVTLLQSGEVFASPMHLRWLYSLRQAEVPELRIELTTNGTLLAQGWDSIQPAHFAIRTVSISVDAATEATYERVRRGGKWAAVQAGMTKAASLRAAGLLDRLQLNFCCSADNFREVPAFVALAATYGADRVQFTMLRRWWHSKGDYQQRSLETPGHPDHAEFARIAADPSLDRHYVDARQLRAAAQI